MYQFQRISYCYRLTKCDILLASSGEENPTGSDAKKWGLFDYIKNGGEGYEISMSASGLNDDQAVILGCKIKIDLLHLRLVRIQEINRDQTADCARHLIKQSGSLVPVYVLCILSDMGIGDSVHPSLIEETIDHRTQKHLE